MRLGRVLGGLGGAAAGLASKYIDDEIAQQRAQAMADLQVSTAGRMREDQAAFEDRRAPALRERAAADARATASLQDEIELSRLGNNPLIEARRKRAEEDALSAASTQRKVVKESAADPDFIKAQKTIKLSDPVVRAQIDALRAQAASAFANAEAQGMTNRSVKRVQDLTSDMLDALDDKTLSPEQRAQKLAGLQSKLDILVPKKAEREDRATQEVVEEYDADGKPIGRTVTTKGPAGMAASGQAAGPDTQALIDYALKNGKVPQLVAKMEADGMSPGDIMRAIGEDEYAKAKGDVARRGAQATKDSLESKSDMQLQRIAQLRLSGATHPEALRAQRILAQRAADRQKSTQPDALAMDISRYLGSRN